MKNPFTSILFILLVSATAISQTIELQLAAEKNCTDRSYCIDIQLKSGGMAGISLAIGTSSMLLTYDADVVVFKNYLSKNFDDASPCNGWLPHRYDAISRRGEIEITLVLEEDGNACPFIGDDLVAIGTICFDIVKQGASPNIRFDLNHTQFNTNDSNDGTAAVVVSEATIIDEINILNCDCIGSGKPCDDGNVYTVNDRYDVFCHCLGQYLDSDADGILDGVDACLDQVYEAEEATLSGVSIEKNEPQYSGSGFAEYSSNTDDFIEFEVNVTNGGLHQLAFRYALEAGNRPLELAIDGNVADPALEFPVTGSWANWDTISIVKFINTGTHTIRLTTIGQNGSNVDQLILSSCSGCTETGLPCNDNDPCTIDDVIDANCNCGGRYEDSDFDGVCNESDTCEGHDDLADTDGDGIPDGCDNCDNALIGTPCNDNDPCTDNDLYITGCQCLGTFIGDDSDGDGVCDDFDICPAGNDAFDADNDGIPDACDTCDERQIGRPCDDGDPCTLLDVVETDCDCTGFFFDSDGDNVCFALDQCLGFDDTIDNDGDGLPDACDGNIPISPKIEIGKVSGVGDNWLKINLKNTYQSMVVVATVILENKDQLPVVTRIKQASGAKFKLRVQNPSGPVTDKYNVQYVVAEEGIYTESEDGFKMEARKELSVETAWAHHYELEPRAYLQSYSSPVVVGQVMTFNDPRWSVFWSSRHDVREEPADPTGMSASKQIAQDTSTTRLNETIGFLVIEAGNYSMDGLRFEARLGENSIKGTEDTETGSIYSLNLGAANHSVLSMAGMNSANGGWPVLFGPQPHRGNLMYLAIDEDQIEDEERSHDEEQVSYFAFEMTHPLTIASIEATSVQCNGGNDGLASVAMIGGEEPYHYQWSNGRETATIDSLEIGGYTVTITDANGTAQATSTTIGQPPAISAGIQGSAISCFGMKDGFAKVISLGGTGQHNYLWSNGKTTKKINNLPSGEYTVTITDGNGCTLTRSYEVTEPLELTVTAAKNDVSCFGGNNGSVMANAIGGTGSQLIFAWSNGDSTQNIADLTAGIYTITVTDGNDCMATEAVEVVQPPLLELEVTSTFTSCNGGNDASATVTFSGGAGTIAYLWSNGKTTPTIDGLPTGTFSVTATDASGCTATASTNITDPAMLSVEVETNDPSCINALNGSAEAMVSGGTGSIAYLWSNGDTTSVIDGLGPGNYQVTVTDINGCTATSIVELFGPGTLSVEITIADPRCNNAMDGSVEAIATGGFGNITYLWSTGDTASFIENLGSGSYEVTVTDGNGCLATSVADLIDPPPLHLSLMDSHASCEGVNNGAMTANASGGTGNLSYMWNTGDTTAFINNLFAGEYSVTVTDENGCDTMAMDTVENYFQLFLNAVVVDVSCHGTANGIIDLSPFGTTEPYHYEWSDNIAGNESAAWMLEGGTYYVTVSDPDGCGIVDTFQVSEPDEIQIVTDSVIAAIGNNADGAINISVSGGTPGYSYQWFLGNDLISVEEDPTGLLAGEYTLMLTDVNNCDTSLTITVESVTSAEERHLSQHIHLTPNPTSGLFSLFLDLPNSRPASVSIYDISGKAVFVDIPVEGRYDFDLSNEAAGVYLLQVRVGETEVAKRIVVID